MNKIIKYTLVAVFIISFLGSCKIGVRNQRYYPKTYTDARDGEVYQLVTIGQRTWFAENLRYKAEGSFSYPGIPSKKYGRLYDWETALHACPKGWHLPTDEEWKLLEIALRLDTASANEKGWRGKHSNIMKSRKGWVDGDLLFRSKNGNNRSAFNVLPAGIFWSDRRDTSERYHSLGEMVSFWSATTREEDAAEAWHRSFLGYSSEVGRYTFRKLMALSCRCIQDPA